MLFRSDARPIRMRPRRLPLARQEAVDQALWEIQQAGRIEPSDSPWAAAVVMVPKEGVRRFCVDYRPLNAVKRKDIPRTDEALDVVAGSSWFSSLDLHSSYYTFSPPSPLMPDPRLHSALAEGCGSFRSSLLASAMHLRPSRG